ncbi:MAG: hypothetical protein AAFN43_07400 [Pseudomonadota bacterium]
MIADRHDQPEGPRIRTKTNLLPDKIDDAYLAIIHRLRRGEISVETYHRECLDYFHPILSDGVMRDLERKSLATNGELELLRRHIDECRYTVIMYRVPEGYVHPPHHHFNVISTQIVLQGKIRIREYDRIGRNADGQLQMALVSDRTLGEGDWFQASEWKRNVHWFQAVDGDALVFNTNARGFEPETFDQEEGRFGRRYIDPTSFSNDGTILAREIDEAEANALFGNKALDIFPVPRPENKRAHD